MFEGFERRRIAIGDTELNLVTGGEGPPLLLLHGFPQTKAIWHRIAPSLARKFTLVIPDLPGYGASKGPVPDAGNVNYSKRHTAGIMVKLMSALGHQKFLLAGHDRGGRVGYRLVLDHPERVIAFAPLDIVPTLHAWEGMDWKRALNEYHWLFLAQPSPLAEHMIGKDPDFYINHLLNRWAGRRDALAPAAVEDYVRAFRQPSVIAATCADYRAGASLDAEHDKADRDAGKRIGCPVMVIWGRGYLAKKSSSPLAAWQLWAKEASETVLECGHFVAEEEPEACAEALLRFFSGRA
ncbi:MAG TPA: alpha/beta hydrolase [Stellaceae bacterium]|nr:alpha/beta hydrolase [Stellaceae bacterium]